MALLRSTGEGIGLVSLGLDWRPGDEVVLYDQEFPSGVYPFLALERHGVRVRFVEDRGRHRFDADDVAAVMSDRTRVVGVSLVNCYHGFRAPVEQISELCRSRGCLLLVDAVQAAGILPVNVPALGADLVSAHGYKSLCSGYGISFCYVSPGLREQLEVVAPGWKNIEDAPFIGQQLIQRPGNRVLIARLDGQSTDAVIQPVADPSGRARDHWPPRRERLDSHKPERLGPDRRHCHH